MIKKLLIFILLLSVLVVPVCASTAIERGTFNDANYQGYIYNNQTVTFDGITTICGYWGRTPYGATGTGFGYALAANTWHDTLGSNITFTGGTRPFVSPGALHGVHWDAGDTYNMSTSPSSMAPKWVGMFSICDDGNYGTGKWWIMKAGAAPLVIPVNFVIRDFNTNALLPNVSVFISNGQSGLTNASGYVTIGVTPNSSSYTYYMTATGYLTSTPVALSTIGEIGGTIYATLSPGGANEYYITVSPAWIPAGGSQYLYGQLRKSGTSSTNLTDIKVVSWQWHKWLPNGEPSQSFPYYDVTNNNYWLEYQKQTSGIYNGWSGLTNSFSAVKTAALPNPLSLNPVAATGTIITELYAMDIYGNNYYFNTSNLIGDNTSQNTHKVRIQDAYTGGLLQFGLISLKNELSGIWFNVSAQTGEYEFTIAPSTPMTIVCNATGYQDRFYTGVISGVNTMSYCNMMASSYLGEANKTKVIVYVSSTPIGNGYSARIEDSYVTITQLNNSITKSDYTNVEGIVQFSANISTAYTITAEKTGYLKASQTINTAAVNPYEVYLFLGNPYTTSPVPTFTPYATPSPIMTNIGGQVINGTATTCTTDTSNLSPVESIKNAIACFGFSGYLAQSLALAGLIIMVFLVIGGKAGKALGAALGGIIGFLMCIALGILPLWILIAFIVIGVGAIAVRALLAGE